MILMPTTVSFSWSVCCCSRNATLRHAYEDRGLRNVLISDVLSFRFMLLVSDSESRSQNREARIAKPESLTQLSKRPLFWILNVAADHPVSLILLIKLYIFFLAWQWTIYKSTFLLIFSGKCLRYYSHTGYMLRFLRVAWVLQFSPRKCSFTLQIYMYISRPFCGVHDLTFQIQDYCLYCCIRGTCMWDAEPPLLYQIMH